MRAIGVRELRQHASRYLREVQDGETIEVTDHGRPIAMLVPVPKTGPIQSLVASGRLIEAIDDVSELGDPLEPAPGLPPPSQVLEEIRSDER